MSKHNPFFTNLQGGGDGTPLLLWNANTNDRGLKSGVGKEGEEYTVSIPGTTQLDGHSFWDIADTARFVAGKWNRIAASTMEDYIITSDINVIKAHVGKYMTFCYVNDATSDVQLMFPQQGRRAETGRPLEFKTSRSRALKFATRAATMAEGVIDLIGLTAKTYTETEELIVTTDADVIRANIGNPMTISFFDGYAHQYFKDPGIPAQAPFLFAHDIEDAYFFETLPPTESNFDLVMTSLAYGRGNPQQNPGYICKNNGAQGQGGNTGLVNLVYDKDNKLCLRLKNATIPGFYVDKNRYLVLTADQGGLGVKGELVPTYISTPDGAPIPYMPKYDIIFHIKKPIALKLAKDTISVGFNPPEPTIAKHTLFIRNQTSVSQYANAFPACTLSLRQNAANEVVFNRVQDTIGLDQNCMDAILRPVSPAEAPYWMVVISVSDNVVQTVVAGDACQLIPLDQGIHKINVLPDNINIKIDANNKLTTVQPLTPDASPTFKKVTTELLDGKEGSFKQLLSDEGNIENLVSQGATITSLIAANSHLSEVSSVNIVTTNFKTNSADIGDINGDTADITDVKARTSTIDALTSPKATIADLTTSSLSGTCVDDISICLTNKKLALYYYTDPSTTAAKYFDLKYPCFIKPFNNYRDVSEKIPGSDRLSGFMSVYQDPQNKALWLFDHTNRMFYIQNLKDGVISTNTYYSTTQTGLLADLTTSVKTSLVSAINSVKAPDVDGISLETDNDKLRFKIYEAATYFNLVRPTFVKVYNDNRPAAEKIPGTGKMSGFLSVYQDNLNKSFLLVDHHTNKLYLQNMNEGTWRTTVFTPTVETRMSGQWTGPIASLNATMEIRKSGDVVTMSIPGDPDGYSNMISRNQELMLSIQLGREFCPMGSPYGTAAWPVMVFIDTATGIQWRTMYLLLEPYDEGPGGSEVWKFKIKQNIFNPYFATEITAISWDSIHVTYLCKPLGQSIVKLNKTRYNTNSIRGKMDIDQVSDK